MRIYAISLAMSLLVLISICACGKPSESSVENGSANNSSGGRSNSSGQSLPFDRQPHPTGTSPSQLLIPSATRLREGTTFTVRLQNPLSSASAHSGDSFAATLDDALIVDGQVVVAKGTLAKGRVLEAKAADESEPGYLRIVLVSVNVGGKSIMIDTSSIFAKGRPRNNANAAGAQQPAGDQNEDVIFSPERRLNFRLAQTVDTQ